jgi:hypothetical protein
LTTWRKPEDINKRHGNVNYEHTTSSMPNFRSLSHVPTEHRDLLRASDGLAH